MLPAIWSGQEAFLGNLRELLASVFKRLGAVPPMGIGIVSVTRDGSPIQMSQIRSSGTIFDPHEQPQLAEATESTAKHMANSAARNISIHGASLRGFALAKEVRDALKDCDPRISRRSYVSEAVGLGTSDVVLWLEFDRAKHDRMPSVFMKSLLGTENVGLLQSAVEVILGRLCDELGKSDLWISGHRWEMKALAEDILREAGRHLMRRIRFSLTRSYGSSSLFDELNTLASIRYEQTEPMGGLVLEPVGSTAEPLFSSPVDLDDPAAARKMLQMARRPYWGLLRWSAIIGLAKRAPADPAEFRVQFRGQGRWDLLHGPKRLAQVKFGVPQVPARRLSRHRFARAFARTFPSNVTGVEKVWPLVQAAMRQGHGAMLVVAADAESEAVRLAQQGTPVQPQCLSPTAIRRVTSIDGAVLVDPDGLCHAVGVILDGTAHPRGDRSRGARYNSARRYVQRQRARLVVVVSVDGKVDLVAPESRAVRENVQSAPAIRLG